RSRSAAELGTFLDTANNLRRSTSLHKGASKCVGHIRIQYPTARHIRKRVPLSFTAS
ncbi:hypothetical protein WUBG_17110, partial [Wuchereria bancrofti]